MSQVTSTIVHVVGQNPTPIGNDLSIEAARQALDDIYGTSSMDAREEIADGIRHIYFSRRTGTKGAVTSTIVHVVGQNPTPIGNDLSIEAARQALDDIYGTSSMDAREEIADGIRHIYFSRRTGTKG